MGITAHRLNRSMGRISEHYAEKSYIMWTTEAERWSTWFVGYSVFWGYPWHELDDNPASLPKGNNQIFLCIRNVHCPSTTSSVYWVGPFNLEFGRLSGQVLFGEISWIITILANFSSIVLATVFNFSTFATNNGEKQIYKINFIPECTLIF